MDMDKICKKLESEGFIPHVMEDCRSAAEFLLDEIHGTTVGIGGSMTVEALNIYDRLCEDNQVFWHWKQKGAETIRSAGQAAVYLSSANGVAETGEIINIDGTGNRVASLIFGHEKVYLIVGQNKIAPDLHQAMWRAKNIASPLNARRLGLQTPCAAAKEQKCYDCSSAQRICNATSILERKPGGIGEYHVILVKEDLGY